MVMVIMIIKEIIMTTTMIKINLKIVSIMKNI